MLPADYMVFVKLIDTSLVIRDKSGETTSGIVGLIGNECSNIEVVTSNSEGMFFSTLVGGDNVTFSYGSEKFIFSDDNGDKIYVLPITSIKSCLR